MEQISFISKSGDVVQTVSDPDPDPSNPMDAVEIIHGDQLSPDDLIELIGKYKYLGYYSFKKPSPKQVVNYFRRRSFGDDFPERIIFDPGRNITWIGPWNENRRIFIDIDED